MILFELTGEREDHPAYEELAVSNQERYYSFLKSAVLAALAVRRPVLSQTVIKALNYHAIACLHTSAGEYRPCEVGVGDYLPPEHFRLNALMDDFVNVVNRGWETTDPGELTAFVLWRLNHIHPFVNGNGRTARAACYFVFCLKLGAWPNTDTILPQLLVRERQACIRALKIADRSGDLAELAALVSRLLDEQLGDQR